MNGEILGRSEAVPLTLPEAADVASTLVNLPFGRELEPAAPCWFRWRKGCAPPTGSRLAREVRFLAQVPDFPEALRIMQRGSVLALTGQTALSLYSRNPGPHPLRGGPGAARIHQSSDQPLGRL